MTDFGERLKMYRTNAGIGLREFARRLKITSAYVCRVEKGRDNPPSVELLERMEAELGLKAGTLVAEAKKVPSDFVEAFTKNDENTEMLPRFMRLVKSGKLKRSDWERILEETENCTKGK